MLIFCLNFSSIESPLWQTFENNEVLAWNDSQSLKHLIYKKKKKKLIFRDKTSYFQRLISSAYSFKCPQLWTANHKDIQDLFICTNLYSGPSSLLPWLLSSFCPEPIPIEKPKQQTCLITTSFNLHSSLYMSKHFYMFLHSILHMLHVILP